MSAVSNNSDEIPNIKSILKLKKKYEAPAETKLPSSYRTSSSKELLWLWCCKNFQKQLKFSRPYLTAMCLSPKNECDVEKLVCTFIRPTVLPFAHLFNIEECARFDHIPITTIF